MAIVYPPVIINEYLAEKVPETIPNRFSGAFRFFPTLPTDIDALTEGFPEASTDVFGIYDRMFKLRRGPFPHIKFEQLLYYFYKINSDPEGLIETSQIVHDLLDRGDESAEEINYWTMQTLAKQKAKEEKEVNPDPLVLAGNLKFGTGALARYFKPVYFHELKVYQLEETRDIVDFGTARTYAGNKIIIDYKYHIPVDVNNDSVYTLFPS